MVDGKEFLHDLGRAADFVTYQSPETLWAQVLMQFLLSLIRLVQAGNIKCFGRKQCRPASQPGLCQVFHQRINLLRIQRGVLLKMNDILMVLLRITAHNAELLGDRLSYH